jgi:hypothetical protein
MLMKFSMAPFVLKNVSFVDICQKVRFLCEAKAHRRRLGLDCILISFNVSTFINISYKLQET